MEQGLDAVIKRKAITMADRAEAIKLACQQARAGDLILVAGKGHESTQVIGQTIRPFSDRVEVARLFGLMDREVQHAS